MKNGKKFNEKIVEQIALLKKDCPQLSFWRVEIQTNNAFFIGLNGYLIVATSGQSFLYEETKKLLTTKVRRKLKKKIGVIIKRICPVDEQEFINFHKINKGDIYEFFIKAEESIEKFPIEI